QERKEATSQLAPLAGHKRVAVVAGGTITGAMHLDGGQALLYNVWSPLSVSGSLFIGTGGYLNVANSSIVGNVSNTGVFSLTSEAAPWPIYTIDGTFTQTSSGTLLF